jgi:hypothetical protein
MRMMLGRPPQSTRSEREGTAATLAPYWGGHLFINKFAGKCGWKRSPVGDELVQIINARKLLLLGKLQHCGLF